MNVSKRLDSLQEAVEFADEMDRILRSYQGFQEVQTPPDDSVDAEESDSEFDYSACHIPDGYTMINERRKAKQEPSDTDNDVGGGCSLM